MKDHQMKTQEANLDSGSIVQQLLGDLVSGCMST